MDYIFLTISLCFLIITYYASKWAFRAIAIIIVLKLITHFKEKGMEAFKQKMGGFMDGDNV